MTWNVYRNPETSEFVMVPTGEPAPNGWVLEVITANPEYLTLYVPQE